MVCNKLSKTDIWVNKIIYYGWTLDDLPNEAIRNEVELAIMGKFLYYEGD